jgi:hypothetical protein
MSAHLYKDKVIERLADRVFWYVQNTWHVWPRGNPENPPGPRPAIDDTADIIELINATLSAPTRENPQGERKRSRSALYTFLGGSEATPWSVIKALRVALPAATIDALTCGTYSEFEHHVATMQQQIDRWLPTATFVQHNRAEVERAAKAYYSEVDESPPGFPLITKSGWLPPMPIELTEDDDYEPFETSVHDVASVGSQMEEIPYVLIMSKLMTDGKKPFNGPTFRLLGIDPSGDPRKLKFGPGKYFNYINTCEFAAAELAEVLEKRQELTAGSLPCRGEPRDIFEFHRRSAFPGVNCLLMLKGHEEWRWPKKDRFVMHLRDGSTTEAANTNHVVPAGGHQPVSDQFLHSFEQRIWRTAVREFIEELFNKQEAHEIRSTGDDFFDDPSVKLAVNNIFRDRKIARVFFLGLGLDPATTKPEILVSIVIDWQKVLRKDWTGFMPTRRNKRGETIMDNFGLYLEANYEGTIRRPDLTREALMAEKIHPYDGKTVLPAGAACLDRASDPDFYRLLYNSVGP